jgi:hypothetical protein
MQNKHKKHNNKSARPERPLHVLVDDSRSVYTTVPKIIVQPIRDWKLRFVNTGAALLGRSFTSMELASIMGIVASGTTTSVYLSSVFRLKRIQIWCLPSAVGTPCTVQAFWANVIDSGFVLASAPKPVTDTSLSVDRYAYVSLNIPRNSAVIGKWWNVVHSVSPVVLTAPPDAIIEFDFQFIVDDLGVPAAGPTVAAGIAGTIYHRTVAGLTIQGLNAI